MIRDDLSDRLIHLTRGDTDQAAAETFMKILGDRKLRGGTGCIKGGFTCVCFSEAPVGKLSHILAQPTAHQMRYKPFGIMVSKEWLFVQGGRPVIYQPDSEYDLLDGRQRFRHVRYEPEKGIDFTWEREWRIQTGELDLESDAITAVVPTRQWEEQFHDRHMRRLSGFASLSGGLTGPTKLPWHFIVLEDLGVSIPSVDPPR